MNGNPIRRELTAEPTIGGETCLLSEAEWRSKLVHTHTQQELDTSLQMDKKQSQGHHRFGPSILATRRQVDVNARHLDVGNGRSFRPTTSEKVD